MSVVTDRTNAERTVPVRSNVEEVLVGYWIGVRRRN